MTQQSVDQPHTAEKAAASGFHTSGVLLISLCHFIHDVYSSFLAPLLPLLIEKLSMSLARAGLLTTVMQLPSLLNPLIGVWADRISVRWFIILAPATTAIPMSLLGLAPSYGVLLIIVFITGISTAIFHVPSPVIIAKLSGNFKGRGMSFFMTGGELARSLGPMVAVGAVSWLGLEGYYPVMVFGVLASAWLYLQFKDVPIATGQGSKTTVKGTWREMRFILLPLAGILVARGFMHASLITFLPTFIKLQTGDLWLAGISLTMVEAAGVVGVLAAGFLSDTFGRRQVLLVSLIGAPLLLAGFVWMDGWPRYVVLAATGFTLLSTSPVMMALVQEHSVSSPAAANGIYMMVSFMARSAVVVIVGFIGDHIGLYTTYLLSAALGLLGIPFILLLPRGKVTRQDRL
jgi:FSR family fosmidomycin resistance protein-like MFS transporter